MNKIMIFAFVLAFFFALPMVQAEKAWFPMDTMYLTQIAFESYSHADSQHIDCVGSTYAFAPFTGKIINQSSNFGVMIFQSCNKVKYADGSSDYMTVMFMHGYPLYKNGTVVSQGQNLYKLGGLGPNGEPCYGVHLDCGVYRGKRNDFGAWYSQFGNTYPFHAFFVNKSKTNIVFKGRLEPGNYVTHNAPTDYSNLWKSTTDNPSSGVDITYQTYDYVRKAWLPNVVNTTDYAGNYGNAVSAVYANLSRGNVMYRVHVPNRGWLPEVKNREDFAGLISQPIDGLMMRTDTGKTIHYRVHLKGGNWLDYVTGYSTGDSNNGYAGILGKSIDAIQAYVN